RATRSQLIRLELSDLKAPGPDHAASADVRPERHPERFHPAIVEHLPQDADDIVEPVDVVVVEHHRIWRLPPGLGSLPRGATRPDDRLVLGFNRGLWRFGC